MQSHIFGCLLLWKWIFSITTLSQSRKRQNKGKQAIIWKMKLLREQHVLSLENLQVAYSQCQLSLWHCQWSVGVLTLLTCIEMRLGPYLKKKWNSFFDKNEWCLYDTLPHVLIDNIQKVYCLDQAKWALEHYNETKMLLFFIDFFQFFLWHRHLLMIVISLSTWHG